MTDFELVAERLSLRRFREDDLPAFVAYRDTPETARYQARESTCSMADAEVSRPPPRSA